MITYEHYYYVPCLAIFSVIQTDLIVDGKTTKYFEKIDIRIDSGFLCPCRVYKTAAGLFLLRNGTKAFDSGQNGFWRGEEWGCGLSGYQAETLKEYFGEEVEMMVLVCQKVKQYLDMQRS